MKQLSRRVAVPVAGLAVVATTMIGAATVSAASPPGHPTAVQRQAYYQQSLTRAVTKGTITSAQESAILTEHQTLITELQAAANDSSSVKKQVTTQVYQEALA